MVHEKEFIHHPPKISTHMHILIKVYDLFLLGIRFLTYQNMRNKCASKFPIPTAPPKQAFRSRMKKTRTTKALVRNQTQ
jgi:hypothetical protein